MKPAERPIGLNHQVLIFVIVRTVINTMVRMIYPLLGVFGVGLGVTPEMLALGLAIRQLTGLVGPFLASVADSRGRKIGMLFGLLLFTGGVGLVVLSPGYIPFLLALVLSILGNFVFIPSMQAYLGDRVAYEKRGRVLGLTELSWSLSFLVGVPLMVLIIAHYGWKAPFPILTGLGFISMIVIFISLPGDPRQTTAQPSLWNKLKLVLTFVPAIAGFVMAAALSASNELINVVFGTWLNDAFNLKLTSLGLATIVIGTSELFGELLSTGLVDRLGKIRAVLLGLVINGIFFLSLPLFKQTLPGALTSLFLIYMSFEFALVCSIPMMTEVLPVARATLMATFIASFSIGRSLGDLVAFPLYHLGIPFVALGGILLNGVAVVAVVILRARSGKTKESF